MPNLRLTVVVAVLACLCKSAIADESGVLPNPGFSDGLSGWVFRPGDQSQVSLLDQDGGGSVLALHPDGRLLGVETERLSIGDLLQADQAYRVTARLKFEGLEKGVFAFSMYCFDAAGSSLEQIVFYGLNTNSKPHDWRTLVGKFGPGTQHPLPEGTASVAIRFSFHDRSGDCQGRVTVDDVALQTYDPPEYEGWPREIAATVGDLGVRFESRSFWTLYRIDYRDTRLCLDRWGSHYGSVVRFPGVGFIGSGHTENEDEQILGLKLYVDDQPVPEPKEEYQCNSLRLWKKSQIRDIVLETNVEVRDNRVLEHVRLEAQKPTPVELIYHFMHPWTQTATEYCGRLVDGTFVEGVFDGDRTQKLDRPTRWSAIYDGPSGKGAVTCVLEVPEDDDWRTRYWDVPDRYRKHYLATFLGKTVPEGRTFDYRVVTVPFEASQSEWKGTAARIGETCH